MSSATQGSRAQKIEMELVGIKLRFVKRPSLLGRRVGNSIDGDEHHVHHGKSSIVLAIDFERGLAE